MSDELSDLALTTSQTQRAWLCTVSLADDRELANTPKIVIIHQGHFEDDIEFYHDRCNKLVLVLYLLNLFDVNSVNDRETFPRHPRGRSQSALNFF